MGRINRCRVFGRRFKYHCGGRNIFNLSSTGLCRALPPVAANATSAFAVLPGYLSGTLGFSKELKAFDRKQLLRLTIWTVIGGLTGAILLMISSNKAFSGIVPFLLLAATMIFVFSDQLRTWATKNARSIVPFGITGLVIFTNYGGYFNGGLGIVLLALFAL